jgi:hypothetical protein
VETRLYEYYYNKLFQIHRWWSFRGIQKSENKLVKSIEDKFGKDAVLAYGDWSNPEQMKGIMPSPTVGLRRVLSKHFRVVTETQTLIMLSGLSSRVSDHQDLPQVQTMHNGRIYQQAKEEECGCAL